MMSARGFADWYERLRIIARFRRKVGFFPNLEAPRTFCEKMQRFKLDWRIPVMATLTDKVTAKAAVAEVLGDDWIIPTLWHGPRLPGTAERAKWAVPFVIKANQGSGRNYFVRSDADLDWPRIERITRRWMRSPHGARLGEWAYSQFVPQLLVEPMLGDDIIDYKLMVFRGRVEFIRVHAGRHTDHKLHHYSRDWEKLPWSLRGYNSGGAPIARPRSLAPMIAGAEQLLAAYPFPFARIDLYEANGQPKFGEFSLYSGSGMNPIEPANFELEAGELWGEVGFPAA